MLQELMNVTVYQCQCDICLHSWRSLTIPTACPNTSCRTRTWNGPKRNGAPPRSTTTKPKRESRPQLSEWDLRDQLD